jgi:hypothetical protein
MVANNSCRAVFFLYLSSVALGQGPPSHQLSILVYDAAGIGPKTLERTEHLAELILSASGLQSTWSVGRAAELGSLRMDFIARAPHECLAALILSVLRVQILRHAPPSVAAQALGFSLPCARAGVHITIYADRVATVSETGGPTFARALAYAIAHELGHVLLHSAGHETSGLMKGVWSKTDWQRAPVSIISFRRMPVSS